MSRQHKPQAALGPGDDVAALAAGLIDDIHGLDSIEREIVRATADSRWDDLGKWHRVRLRYLRLRQQRDLSEGCGEWLYRSAH